MAQLFRDAIGSQLGAALTTLEHVVEACPDDYWSDGSKQPALGRVVYHAAFYVHLYLSESEAKFSPRSIDVEGLYDIGGRVEPIPTRDQLRDYLKWLRGHAADRIEKTDEATLAAPSPFPWLPMSLAESIVCATRHVQHHAAEAAQRVKTETGAPIKWVGIAPLR